MFDLSSRPVQDAPLLKEADPDAVLRDGLRRLPAPPVSAGFDARVLAALAQPPTLWEQLRASAVSTLRPLLCGTACSLAVTLGALFWTLHAPPCTVSEPGPPARAARPLDMAAVDDLLNRPMLGARSLTVWAGQSAAGPVPLLTPPAPPEGEHRPPRAGRRRASRSLPALLTA